VSADPPAARSTGLRAWHRGSGPPDLLLAMAAAGLLGWAARAALPEAAVAFSRAMVMGAGLAACVWRLGARLWVLDLVRHFPVQLLLASTLAAGALAGWSGDAAWCGGAVVSMALWLVIVSPVVARRRPVPSPGSADGHTLRVLYANVLTESRGYARVTEQIAAEDADVVALIEPDEEWLQALDMSRHGYPYMVADPVPDHFGVALCSRLPLGRTAVIDLGDMGMPAVLADVPVGPGGSLRVLLVHSMPPKGPARARMRDRQLAAAADIATDEAGPLLLVGDLNVTPWSAAYGRLLRAGRLQDGRAGHGLCATWPAPLPWFLRLPIDTVLVSGVEVLAVGVGPTNGSDHRPLVLDLCVPSVAAPSPAPRVEADGP
jgi:endonuclease/exonuclease/phosphatase (EEP) superfamily protein YafD